MYLVLETSLLETSLLVLARPDRTDEAIGLIGRGVNRVMLATDPPELIGKRAAELLDIAPRTTFRFSTRLLDELADGSDEVLGAVVNISSSGMLVETDADLEPGQHVIISIHVAGDDEPLAVKAEVVRHAEPDRDGVEGVGVRFLKFAGGGRSRRDAILAEGFNGPAG